MRFLSLLILSLMGISATCMATEKLVGENDKISLDISIYNQNLALVKDVRKVALEQGVNDIAFEGVAEKIKSETAILYSDGLTVLEQNYDYDLLTANNIVDKSVGDVVKTVIQNPTTGENIYNKAKIVSASYGLPILEFDYGIEANFPGRLVFEKLPTSLREKPTLVAKVISDTVATKNISLAYLTNGISWKTNYVAKVTGKDKLNLTGWVTINNESGIDYNNAKVQLIAGNVNEVVSYTARPIMLRSVVNDMAVAEASLAKGASEQELSGYHLYTLPNKTTIKDKQTKQISLIEKNEVKYTKEAMLSSRLYFSPNSNSEFKQVHPDMYYVINNNEEDNLGLQLPAGVVRFYEDDDNGNLQFIGENSISHVAKGETIRLRLGSFVNMFASGKIKQIKKLSEEQPEKNGNRCNDVKSVYSYDAEIEFTNSGKNPQEVVYTQNLPQDSEILVENKKGILKNASTYEWRFIVPADGKQILNFVVKAPYTKRVCN
ncbi:MAG: DUF4139 domain-containing protein [Alphaproteobacteria bacterium]|nr:DUF4139 domain-containing protein [Alphaproteobacteria bacterium]